MKSTEIFSTPYLTARAEQVIRDSLKQLDEPERHDFAADALRFAENNNAPIEFIDELYLASL